VRRFLQIEVGNVVLGCCEWRSTRRGHSSRRRDLIGRTRRRKSTLDQHKVLKWQYGDGLKPLAGKIGMFAERAKSNSRGYHDNGASRTMDAGEDLRALSLRDLLSPAASACCSRSAGAIEIRKAFSELSAVFRRRADRRRRRRQYLHAGAESSMRLPNPAQAFTEIPTMT